MRDIKFRARRTDNGQWVYGYYKYSEPRLYHMIEDSHGNEYEVDPETVGQYTGLKDKNGNPIYEGDIIETGTGKIVIEFRDGGFGWTSKIDGESFISFAGHNYLEKILNRFKVIGNVHENPELL